MIFNAKKRSLLIFIHNLSSGGAERVTANLANYWAEKGWQITIVTISGTNLDFYHIHPDINRITLCLDHDSTGILAEIKHSYYRIKALRKVLKQQQPEVTLAMMGRANVLLAIAAKGLNVATIGSERNHPPMIAWTFILQWLRQRLYGHLDAVTALTVENAVWLKKHTSARYVPVIPNAVTYPIPSHPPEVRPNISSAGFNLLAVGRLEPQKGFERLLFAFAILAPRFPDWNLIILGEGECRESLEKQRHELGLERRILIPGVVGNLGDWYESVDLYVMTSLFEGFPNTLGEALAHGLPVVSVDCDTGPRDIIRHEMDGVLVPQDNREALLKALSTLMNDAGLRKQYATRAIEVRERFSMERIAGMWEDLFEDVSAGKG